MPKPQRWDKNQRAIGYLGQFLQYASKPIVECVQIHQPTCENMQQFRHHYRKAHRMAYPVDHQVKRYQITQKSYLLCQLHVLEAV